jgi:hypothetical protein
MGLGNGSTQRGCRSDVICTSGTSHTLAEHTGAEHKGEVHTAVGQEGRHTAVLGFGHRTSWSHISR